MGGDPATTLVLLHGLGATGAVFDELVTLAAERWPGPCLAPDLPGHGDADWSAPYSFGSIAAEVARHLDPDTEVVVVGHSMGGVIALTLASGWFRVPVRLAVGLGIKLRWDADELAGAAALAAKPVRSFATREEATARFLRVSGLDGLVGPDDPRVARGVVEDAEGWRLTQDPATFGVGAPDVEGLLAAARASVVLAAGEHDPMCPPDHLRAVQREGVVLDGLGHNAHVEDPAAVWALLDAAARAAGDPDAGPAAG